MKKLLILSLTLFFTNSFSCDCKAISKEKEYLESEIILLGKIKFINDKYFIVQVLENFKANTDVDVKFPLNNCSINPKIGETWLIYAFMNSKKYFDINQCGNSRSFTNPFNKNSINFPTPPPPNLNNNSKKSLLEKNYKIAILELNLDIYKLRLKTTAIKFNNSVTDLNLQNKTLKIIVSLMILIIIALLARLQLLRKV